MNRCKQNLPRSEPLHVHDNIVLLPPFREVDHILLQIVRISNVNKRQILKHQSTGNGIMISHLNFSNQ